MKFNKKQTCDYLIFDITNVLYRTFHAHKRDDDITIAGLATHSALTTLNKYFRQFNPRKGIIMCFDRSSWRKKYTASDECISPKQYKGHRRKSFTPAQMEKYKRFLEHLADFEQLIEKHTSIISLAGEGLEADDLMAGCAQILTMDNQNELILVSTDQDMLQLLRYPNVRLINPANGKDQTLDKWNGDANLFMFEKCIRGDQGDNVQSALPRCHRTKILKAYEDDYTRANLLNQTWTHINGTEYVVRDLFKENQLLMDLTKQPEEIQKHNIATILKGLNNRGTFNYFHFMRFLGKYELKKVAERAEDFANMLSIK